METKHSKSSNKFQIEMFTLLKITIPQVKECKIALAANVKQ